MRLLFVHGMAQGGKDANALSTTWRETLVEGLRLNGHDLPSTTSIDFPYYGDILDGHVDRLDLPMPEEVISKGSGENTEFENFLRNTVEEIKVRKDFPDAEIENEMNEDGPREKGVQNWEWVQAIVKVIDRNFSGVVDFTFRNFIQEVFVYLDNRNAQRDVNRVVADLITDEPTLVVGHSLGSVVAYQVLAEHGDSMDLRGFVTVGSPLGIRTTR